MVPKYTYWPVCSSKPGWPLPQSEFFDGGFLENTGLGGLLAYQDIDSAIVFVNGDTPLSIDQNNDVVVDYKIRPSSG